MANWCLDQNSDVRALLAAEGTGARQSLTASQVWNKASLATVTHHQAVVARMYVRIQVDQQPI
jgi:hypothetical protein